MDYLFDNQRLLYVALLQDTVDKFVASNFPVERLYAALLVLSRLYDLDPDETFPVCKCLELLEARTLDV